MPFMGGPEQSAARLDFPAGVVIILELASQGKPQPIPNEGDLILEEGVEDVCATVWREIRDREVGLQIVAVRIAIADSGHDALPLADRSAILEIDVAGVTVFVTPPTVP